MGNRKLATDIAVKRLDELLPNTGSGERLRIALDRLNETEFAAMMQRWLDGTDAAPVQIPNLKDSPIKKTHLIAVTKRWGCQPFQRMIMTDPETRKPFKTPLRYMTLPLMTPRLSQTQESKASLPKDQHHIDEMTGQVTGDSKGARISFPELGNLAGGEAKGAIVETIKVRGGDAGAQRQFDHDVILNGVGDLNKAIEAGTGVTATKNLGVLLETIHLGTTLNK